MTASRSCCGRSPIAVRATAIAARRRRGKAIRLWLRLRDEAGLGGAKLCWVRDAVRESRLPDGLDESVVPRWEAMAEALDERLSGAEASGPMVAATRDAVALAALLPGAVLLSLRDDPNRDEPPALCRHLEDWGVPCRRLDALDDLVAMERGLMLQLLVEAGLAGLIWAGIRLALVHLVVPGRSRLPLGPGFPPHGFGAPGDEVDFLTEMPPGRCGVFGRVLAPSGTIWMRRTDMAKHDPVRLRLNSDELVMQAMQGQIAHAVGRENPYRIGHDGVPRILPGTGGISINCRIGDPCVGLAADHVEPGVALHNNGREIIGPASGPIWRC
ncbi:MAG: DUF4438 domain-containing protein [Aliidongia sp.]